MVNLTPEEVKRQYLRAWKKENKERIKAYNKSWREKNKDKVKLYQEKYWAKKALENIDS